MNIRYILGNCGTGKFSTCTDEIIQIEQQDEFSGILIVPNQFTLQAEKKLMEKIHSKVIFKTQVLSFKRIAYRVFSELGLNNKIPLENCGKLIVLRKIISSLYKDKKLTYFSENSYSNLGVLEKLGDTINELIECDADIEDMDKILEQISKNKNLNIDIKDKLNDIKEIYIQFKNFIQKDYIYNEEILTILSQKLNKSKLINEKTIVWLYGFDGFSSQEIKVIEALAKNTKQINICFTFNGKNINIADISLFDPFYSIKNSMKKINQFAKLEDNSNVEHIFLEKNFRHQNNSELNHLQKNYFSYKPEIYTQSIKNIKIYAAQNKFLELEKVAQEITYLVKQKGYRYKDIALILAETQYKEHLRSVFNKYNLPYFLDYKKNIINYPLVEAIISILDIVVYNFKYEDVFRFLKTGFFQENEQLRITSQDVCIIENYVLQYGIKGDRWKNNFKYGFYLNSHYNKEEINRIRKTIVNTIKIFDFKNNKTYKVSDISKKIFDLLIFLNVDKALSKRQEQDKQILLDEISTNTTMIDTNMQIWNKICEMIDKFVNIMGDEKITIEEYSKILKTIFKAEKIGILPPTQDQILIGDFERTKLGEVKVLFCLGMNDGVIPRYAEQTSFITDTERAILMSKFELKPNASTKLVTDDLQIYSILCKCSEKLILSYSISDLSGNSKKKSNIISKIQKMFQNVDVQEIDKITFDFSNINSPDAMFENLFKTYDQIDKNSEDYSNFKNMFIWFLEDEQYSKRLKTTQFALQKIKNNDIILDKTLIEQLYTNKKLIASVTKLEQFRECPFSYFLKYNIDINEREFMNFDNLKIGNIYHNILESFFEEILVNKIPINKVTDYDILSIIDKTIARLKQTDEIENIYDSSSKYKYFFNRIRKIILTSSQIALEDIKNDKFEPQYLELAFGEPSNPKSIFKYIEVDLENTYKMLLTGKIDRVDKFNDGTKEYYKIVDYKSSESKIKEEEIYNGLKLQLFTYLSAFIKFKNKQENIEIVPSGVEYFQIKEDVDDGKKFSKRINSLKVCNENEDEKGKLYLSHMKALLNLSDITIKEIGKEITDGNIKIQPYKYSGKTGCDYCAYKSVCSFDVLENNKLFNNMYFDKTATSRQREVPSNLDETEIWKKIYKKLEDTENLE